MNIVLVNTDFGAHMLTASTVPLTMYHISAILERADYNVEIFEPMLYRISLQSNHLEALATKSKDADAVLFTSNTFSWSYVLEEIKYLRNEGFSGLIIVGGVHPAFAYKYILTTYSSIIDCLVLGEAENSIVPLLSKLKAKEPINNIPGIAFIDENGYLVVTENKLVDLSVSEIIPSYEKVPENFYNSLSFETSRGCKCRCSFCSVVYKKCWRYYKKSFNDYKMGVMLDTLEERNISVSKTIVFTDDCFTTDPERAATLLNLYADKHNLTEFSIMLEARAVDLINKPSLINSIKRYPRVMIQVGVEAGYDDGWEKIYKPLTYSLLIKLCDYLKEHKLTENFYFSFIVGFPFETVDDCERTISTINFIREKYGIAASVNWWIPLPSKCFDALMKANNEINYSLFDVFDWASDMDHFYSTHPLIPSDQHSMLSEKIINANSSMPTSYL